MWTYNVNSIQKSQFQDWNQNFFAQRRKCRTFLDRRKDEVLEILHGKRGTGSSRGKERKILLISLRCEGIIFTSSLFFKFNSMFHLWQLLALKVLKIIYTKCLRIKVQFWKKNCLSWTILNASQTLVKTKTDWLAKTWNIYFNCKILFYFCYFFGVLMWTSQMCFKLLNLLFRYE